jgi:hypothetical protein
MFYQLWGKSLNITTEIPHALEYKYDQKTAKYYVTLGYFD